MSFVFYRLPRQKRIMMNLLDDEPETFGSFAELNGKKGFVIAPFAPSAECPILLIPAKWIEATELPIGDVFPMPSILSDNSTEMRRHYYTDFNNFHAQLCNDTFSKIVLARSLRMELSHTPNPLQLFKKACEMYPRMFVTLFSTDISGTWLVATPEVLLTGTRGDMSTMALAGTMALNEKQQFFDTPCSKVGTETEIAWSEKNRQEQHYVESYITECIEHFASDFGTVGPYTTRAGNLVHLRTDINFRLNDTSHLGDLLNALHPTPAVCGIPKHEAQQFIIANESTPRGYYSGFSGPIDANGSTHLYVSLRCAKAEEDKMLLFAGGGLLKESVEEQEWEETEAKMETMKKVILSDVSKKQP
jgi:isochorismate synthase